MKALEDPLALGLGNPGAVIDDREANPVQPDSLHLQADQPAAVGRMLNRVTRKVT